MKPRKRLVDRPLTFPIQWSFAKRCSPTLNKLPKIRPVLNGRKPHIMYVSIPPQEIVSSLIAVCFRGRKMLVVIKMTTMIKDTRVPVNLFSYTSDTFSFLSYSLSVFLFPLSLSFFERYLSHWNKFSRVSSITLRTSLFVCCSALILICHVAFWFCMCM